MSRVGKMGWMGRTDWADGAYEADADGADVTDEAD